MVSRSSAAVMCSLSLHIAAGRRIRCLGTIAELQQHIITHGLGTTGHPRSVNLLRPCLWPTLRTGNTVNVLEGYLNRLCRHPLIW